MLNVYRKRRCPAYMWTPRATASSFLLLVGRCMRWRNADFRVEISVFQSNREEEVILRQLRRGIVRRKFGRMGESIWSSLSRFGLSNSTGTLTLYVSLQIYLTTSDLLLSSLTKSFFEDATWHLGRASWSSTVANRCLLHIWRKEWDTRASALRRFVSLFSYNINYFGNDIKRKDGWHCRMFKLNVELIGKRPSVTLPLATIPNPSPSF